MFLIRMCRRPLIPLLLLTEFMLSACFLSVNEKTLRENQASIEQLYDTAVVECRVLPKTVTGGRFAISPFSARALCRQEAVDSYFCVLKDPCYLTQDGPEGNMIVACGTNDPAVFCREMYVTVTLDETYRDVDFKEDAAVCLLDRDMAEELGYRPKDTISVMGGDENGHYTEKAAPQELTVIGTYKNGGSMVEKGAILVPESRFYTRGEKRLTYDAASQNRWYYYIKFSFTLHPAYNRDLERVTAELEEAVSHLTGLDKVEYTLYVGSRELEQALRPLENKTALQQRLSLPMQAAFCVLSAALTLLLAAGERQEILIRRLGGESGTRVLVSTWAALCLLLSLLVLPSLLVAQLLWKGAQTAFLLKSAAVSMFLGGLLLLILCRRKLIALYQRQD